MATISAKVTGFIRLKDAAKYFPGTRGEPICLGAIYRWTTKGVRGVKLRTAQVGAVRCTKEIWIEEFIDKLTARAGTLELKPTPTATDRQKLIERELDALGI